MGGGLEAAGALAGAGLDVACDNGRWGCSLLRIPLAYLMMHRLGNLIMSASMSRQPIIGRGLELLFSSPVFRNGSQKCFGSAGHFGPARRPARMKVAIAGQGLQAMAVCRFISLDHLLF